MLRERLFLRKGFLSFQETNRNTILPFCRHIISVLMTPPAIRKKEKAQDNDDSANNTRETLYIIKATESKISSKFESKIMMANEDACNKLN